MPLVESRGFSFDLETLRTSLSDKTKLVILNSPANPTGGVIPKDDLAQMAAMLRDRDLIVLSDEIYSRIWYDEEPTSITSLDGMLEKTIILDGFSKTYSMTGWRLGYGVMPTWLATAVVQLMVNSNSCTASFTQRAGIAALEGPQDCVTAMVAEFRKRRDAIVKGLNTIPGFRCSVPAGAFYVFPNVSGTGHGVEGAGRSSAERRGRRLPRRHGIRPARRRLPAVQLRQLARQHPRGHRAHPAGVGPLELIGASDKIGDG